MARHLTLPRPPTLQAARAYDSAARAIRGAGAICNFPETDGERRNAVHNCAARPSPAPPAPAVGGGARSASASGRPRRAAAAAHAYATRTAAGGTDTDDEEEEDEEDEDGFEDEEESDEEDGEYVARARRRRGAGAGGKSKGASPPRNILAPTSPTGDSNESDHDMLCESPVFGVSPRFFGVSPGNPLMAVAPGSLGAGLGGLHGGSSGGLGPLSTAVLLSGGLMGSSPVLPGSWGAALAAAARGGRNGANILPSSLGGSARMGSLGGLSASGLLAGLGSGLPSPALTALLGGASDGLSGLGSSLLRSPALTGAGPLADLPAVGGFSADVFMRFSGEANLVMDMELGGCSPATAMLFDEIMGSSPAGLLRR